MIHNSTPTISVIGLTRFGTLISSILSKHFNVYVSHYRDDKDVLEKAKKTGAKFVDFKTACKSDIIITAVPIADTEGVLENIGKIAKKGALIVDTCSVKVLPCQWLTKYIPKDIEIMGTHPMFGPNSTGFNLEKQTWSLSGMQVILCPLRINKEQFEKIKKFLESLKLEVIETTPEDHDKQNATTLSLVHFLGRSLWESGVRDDHKIFTPGFKSVTSIFKHTVNDSWGLFYDMHNFNPYAAQIRQDFIDAVHKMDEKIIENSSQDEFTKMRNIIDRVDYNIFKLLEKRFEAVTTIGKIKKEKGMAIHDPKRESEIIKNKTKMTRLDKKFVEKLFQIFFEESYRIQG